MNTGRKKSKHWPVAKKSKEVNHASQETEDQLKGKINHINIKSFSQILDNLLTWLYPCILKGDRRCGGSQCFVSLHGLQERRIKDPTQWISNGEKPEVGEVDCLFVLLC